MRKFSVAAVTQESFHIGFVVDGFEAVAARFGGKWQDRDSAAQMGYPDCDRSVLSTTNSILCHDTRVTICRDKPSSYNSRGAANSPFSLWLFAGSPKLR